MDALEEAAAALRAAEQKLRAILVQAAEQGDYNNLPQIAVWAKTLTAILASQPVIEPGPSRTQPVLPSLPVNGFPGQPIDDAGGASAPCARAVRSVRHGKKPRKNRAKKAGYPQFVREGDSLVKIAWSKSDGRPYEHKAPKSVLRALIQALTRAGAGGDRFTMEGLLPLKDPADRTDIPDYQTYLTLAWLRIAGLIVQHGRQGYSLREGMDLDRESDRKWNDLKTR